MNRLVGRPVLLEAFLRTKIVELAKRFALGTCEISRHRVFASFRGADFSFSYHCGWLVE